MITFIIGGASLEVSERDLGFIRNVRGFEAERQEGYIASAEALDGEMKERIKKHRKDRGDGWDTFEEPIGISEVLKKIEGQYSVILLDCLTLWLSNLMLSNLDMEKEIDLFCSSLFTVHCSLFIVSNEVGMGIVPENEMARRFRDVAGIQSGKLQRLQMRFIWLWQGYR